MYEIKGFLETSFIDWPGKICSVLFLPRCNFRCPYCHNHSLVLFPDQYATLPWEGILSRLASFRDWIDGICLTGGEPTLHPDLSSIIQEVKRLGYLVKLDTNGSQPQRLESLIAKKEVDFISMDIKAPMNPVHYSRITGSSVNLALLWRSISILKRGDVEYEFRTTVVPGFHSSDDIRQLGGQLKAASRMVLHNFNPENPMDPSLKEIRPYEPERLKELEREIQGLS
jgi:pyruvate formate lyase activating enzyme